jgi:hypothetical protein
MKACWYAKSFGEGVIFQAGRGGSVDLQKQLICVPIAAEPLAEKADSHSNKATLSTRPISASLRNELHTSQPSCWALAQTL